MKLIKTICCICLLGLLLSCENADDLQHVVYFAETDLYSFKRMSVEEPTSIGLSVNTSNVVENELVAKISPNPSLVSVFNKKQNTEYQILSESAYELSASELVITSGKNMSRPIEFHIKSIEEIEDNTTYCVPISITEVSGEYTVLESSRTIYIIIDKTIITSAAYLSSAIYEVPFDKDPSLSSVPDVTLEARIYVNSFQGSNPFISSVMGIEGDFMFRFGDVTIDKAQLQFTGKGFATTTPTKFDTHRWYHIAGIYTPSSVKIYINGRLEVEQAIGGTPIDLAKKHPIDFSGKEWGFCIGASRSGGRYLDGYISEARVWKKALTGDEIINNMCGVKPTTDGLIAYWRFNEGTGNKITDWTGNGWDLTSFASRPVRWMEGVRCPE